MKKEKKNHWRLHGFVKLRKINAIYFKY